MSGPSVVEDIFLAALDKGTPEERAAFLNATCKGDSDLRRRVERLLEAHPKACNFLEQPATPAEAETAPPTGAQAGAVIAGRYKLLQLIGEGGMGSVWMAQQTSPVTRLVAVKLIKAGMDSNVVLARFEAERQALAVMDHPNIAKVLDGGTTPPSPPYQGGAVGRPFFVMELVKGTPITRYCDEHRLPLRQRLELFVSVCQALQHAHQKGIVHRDLKPSNVLVAPYDGRPVPKVIDFGVAKATGPRLTERTLFTEFGAIIGTLQYMSPEQAELNNLDIDTRSDIYSLGVLLYELLTGTTPLDMQVLRGAAMAAVLMAIHEEEPPKPSTRLSQSGDSLPSIAAQRQTEPAKLSRLVRGELDWIVMKALEKDRDRRYETANGLARDLERYLHDEVVEAQPPTAGYRLRKFVRKHRTMLATAAAFAGLLIVAAGISAVLAMKAKRAEVEADKKRIEAEWDAKLAEYNADLYLASLEENFKAYEEADIRAKGLQIDLDVEEMRTTPTVGVLRLAHFLKELPESIVYTSSPPINKPKLDQLIELMKSASQATGKQYTILEGGSSRVETGTPKLMPLRQFATMAVLATGQTYAPLLRPITHDGDNTFGSALSSKGDRLLTRGADRTARLWDPFTGRQIALLRRADEKVIEAGLSPDGATAFTHSWDGVVRLWETKDGAFRAETEPRHERIKSIDASPSDRGELGFAPWTVTPLSNDRVLTCEDMRKRIGEKRNFGPVELWDAKTGRFIAQLGLPKPDATYEFFANGRWIESHDAFGREKTLRVFAAEDGRLIATLTHDEKYGHSKRGPVVSPGGQTAATISEIGQNPREYYVHVWDTRSWRLLSTTGPFNWGVWGEDPEFQWIADDQFAMSRINGNAAILRPATVTPIVELPGFRHRRLKELALFDSGQLFDTKTWRRLQPPPGRKYHPELARFAPDGRFVPLGVRDENGFQFLDSVTEKTFFTGSLFHCFYQARLGWVGGRFFDNDHVSEVVLHRLPRPDRLNIPPDLLELWAQVAVRGQLDEEGAFFKWDESTWEKKRQELAAKPVPHPDFPFPGHVVEDRLHWLRQEYLSASDADKTVLAKKLLDRALAAGDKAEAVRWRAILTPKPSPTKPEAKPSEP